MAYLHDTPHRDEETHKFMTKMKAHLTRHCYENIHEYRLESGLSVWIQKDKFVRNLDDLFLTIRNNGYEDGRQTGKRESVERIHQKLLDIVSDNKTKTPGEYS